MLAIDTVRCSVPISGVEVVTVLAADGTFETRFHGGRLDGKSYKARGNDADWQHERACVLARVAGWKKGRGRINLPSRTRRQTVC